MTNPWTLQGERTALEVSGFGDVPVREGPEFLMHGDTVYLVYSMCGASTPDYRLSALVAKVGDDLSSAASWTQYPKLLLARVDQNSVWGPGHNYFFKSPDGTQDWIAYHGKTSTKDTYGDRSTRAQPIRWRADGTPDFGIPVSYDDPVPVPSGEK
jgi:GH43 family beta-xylosidase